MKILTLLLHDERFSGWTVRDKLTRFHFSLQYLEFCRSFGWKPYLYTFHQSIKEKQVHRYQDSGLIKIFPVEHRFPPLRRFGNDHSPNTILNEMVLDNPDLIHFHNYYLFSFAYTAHFVKRKLRRRLTTQLHGCHNNTMRRSLFLPCLLALKSADRVFYSYKPEESLYQKLGILEKTTRIPIPSIDPSIFKSSKRQNSNTLLYVGRIPLPTATEAEKSPYLLLSVMHKLLRHKGDLKLKILGDGPGLPYCKELACKLKIREHITFQGYIPRSKLPEQYQNSALTIVPLKLYDIDGWFDGSIQESLACGTPVAAFKTSPKAELKGTSGFLLSEDADKAAEELSMLLECPETLKEQTRKGTKFVHTQCTEAKLAEKLRATWEGLLKK